MFSPQITFFITAIRNKCPSTSFTQECSPKHCKSKCRSKDQANLRQVKETATASTPENAAFHGTAPASFPAQKAAASLAAAGACGVRLAQKWTRGMERALGRGRRTDNGDEVGAVVLQDVSGRRRTVGRGAIAMFFFLPLLCFCYKICC